MGAAFVATCAAGLALAGCGSSSLTTSSLLSGGQTAQAAPAQAPPPDPLARPVHAATTSAQAVKCGYFFDPQKMRASFLAQEAQSGPDQAAKSERSYDATFRLVGDRLRSEDDYCTDARAKVIKANLQRHLTGDFTPPARKQTDDSLFSIRPNTPQPFDREKILESGPRERS